jgi:hypothetical protein
VTSSGDRCFDAVVRKLRGFAALIAVLVLASVFAAGTSARPAARGISANAWVTQVCTAITTWKGHVVKRSTAVSKSNPTSLTQLHAALVSFLTGIVADTDRMIAATDAAGTPSVSHGKEVASALHSGLAKLRGYFAQDLSKAKKLSRTNPQKFSAGATALSAALSKQSDQIVASFDAIDKKYPSSELDRALKTAPACRGLN